MQKVIYTGHKGAISVYSNDDGVFQIDQFLPPFHWWRQENADVSEISAIIIITKANHAFYLPLESKIIWDSGITGVLHKTREAAIEDAACQKHKYEIIE